MAAKRSSVGPRPTDAELAILRALWERGPSTVRETWEALDHHRDAARGCTTVLKLMQIMVEKGLLVRDDAIRPQVYRPAIPPERTKRMMTRDFVDRLFGGSARDLVLEALGSSKLSAGELAEIRELLDKHPNRTRKS